MKTLALLAIFAVARPGYHYQFPRDHWSHPEFKTEWWYWTGNLRDATGRRFGFELTFFRQATRPDTTSRGTWDNRDVYLAHLTLSDVATGKFHHFERLNRSGPGLAGALGRVWNGNWEAGIDYLRAVDDGVRLDLRFKALKPLVIHGVNGVSQKSAGEGHASHYISFTRLAASGTVETAQGRYTVDGTAWMDHEFFTHQLEPDQIGWDWMSIQLDNGTDLMLFQLRRRDGSIDPHSAGTIIDPAGRPTHLTARDFTMTSLETWKKYPVRWRVQVPSAGLDLEATTPMRNQELLSKSRLSPTYWEGAMDYQGSGVRGVGYLEMTGYEKPIVLGEPEPEGR